MAVLGSPCMMANPILLYLSALQLLPLQMALKPNFHMPPTKQFEQLVDQIVPNNGLEEGKDILEGDESLINLSVIMTNMAPGSKIFTHLDFFLTKLLDNLTQDSRIRLLVITDPTFANPLRLHLKM